MNGLTNAVKYGASSGPASAEPICVTVAVAPPSPAGSSHLTIEVLDAGLGLRGQTMAQLTTDFGGLADGGSSGVRSSGMGVPIAARLMRLLGGALNLSDRGDGRTGTRYLMQLPIVPAQPPAGGAEVGSGGGGGGPAASPSSAAAAAALDGAVVLVADDSEANRCAAAAPSH